MTRFTRLTLTNTIAALVTVAIVCAIAGPGVVWAAFWGAGL